MQIQPEAVAGTHNLNVLDLLNSGISSSILDPANKKRFLAEDSPETDMRPTGIMVPSLRKVSDFIIGETVKLYSEIHNPVIDTAKITALNYKGLENFIVASSLLHNSTHIIAPGYYGLWRRSDTKNIEQLMKERSGSGRYTPLTFVAKIESCYNPKTSQELIRNVTRSLTKLVKRHKN